MTLTAFRRADGRVGIRNYLAVIAATDAANPWFVALPPQYPAPLRSRR
jgi:altronate dehydratase